MTKKQKKTLYRILVSAVLYAAVAVACALAPLPWYAELILYLIPYFLIGHDVLRKAVLGVVHGEVFDENFLMAVATVGAMALGEYGEGVAVMLFYQVGELFQSYAVGKSRRSIAALMDIRPDSANLEGADGSVTAVDPEAVPVGAVIVVRPGEKIPLDGVVLSGRSTLNTSALTGESRPRTARPGDAVISGSVNGEGLLRVTVSRVYGQSTVARILDLVENSSLKKAKAENFITRFARYYTPAVCFAALALAVLPPLALGGGWGLWVSRALTFLVISCPCALVISIPLSFFAGIGGASNAGVLVKGSNYLETLSQTKIVVFDKTGTLTQGVFEVSGIHHNKLEDEKILEYAALVESSSSHPISKSLQRAYGKEIDRSRVSDIQEISGNGVTAKIDGVAVAAGNGKLMDRLGIPYINCHSVGTIIHMAIDGQYAGHIVISDIVKPHAKEAIAALKKAGIHKTVMLTGDTKAVADKVASELGIDEVYSELLPAGKVEKVEELLQAKPEKAKLAFVGDGINDAPVLTRADVGIAMGALGSDAAIEAADVVLMDDDPAKIGLAMRVARKCMRIVYQNIVFALGIKALFLILSAVGVANMWWAVFADVGVMVLAVLNATRMLNVRAYQKQ